MFRIGDPAPVPRQRQAFSCACAMTTIKNSRAPTKFSTSTFGSLIRMFSHTVIAEEVCDKTTGECSGICGSITLLLSCLARLLCVNSRQKETQPVAPRACSVLATRVEVGTTGIEPGLLASSAHFALTARSEARPAGKLRTASSQSTQKFWQLALASGQPLTKARCSAQ